MKEILEKINELGDALDNRNDVLIEIAEHCSKRIEWYTVLSKMGDRARQEDASNDIVIIELTKVMNIIKRELKPLDGLDDY